MRLIKITNLVLASVLLFTGCIKDKSPSFAYQSSPSNNTVDFINQTESAALDIVATPTIYTFYVELNSSDKSYPATTVTLTKNTAIVIAGGQEFLPDSAYQLVSPTATVDPVTKLAGFQLKVTTTKIDLAHNFAVGFTLASATGGAVIASNKNTIIITIGAKNKYDGAYTMRIKTTGWTAFGIADGVTADYPGDYLLITLGINNVAGNSNRGDFLLPAFAGTTNVPGTLGGPTAFGATTPVFIFDNSTNKLTNVVNSTPDDGRGRFLHLNTSISTSRFDPATRTIYAAFVMTQIGRPDQLFYDTLTYLHSR